MHHFKMKKKEHLKKRRTFFLKHLKRRALLKKRRAPSVLHPMIHTGSTKEQRKFFKLPKQCFDYNRFFHYELPDLYMKFSTAIL